MDLFYENSGKPSAIFFTFKDRCSLDIGLSSTHGWQGVWLMDDLFKSSNHSGESAPEFHRLALIFYKIIFSSTKSNIYISHCAFRNQDKILTPELFLIIFKTG